jgi:hypothetical protein
LTTDPGGIGYPRPVGRRDVQRVAEDLVRWLEGEGDCELEPGLSPAEIDRAESTLGIRMPSQWRRVLGLAHPVARAKPPRGADGVLRWTPYPDWRLRDEAYTAELVHRPAEGVRFDVEHSGFWWLDWGAPPVDVAGRLSVARARLAEAPRLTPLRGNWYVGPADDSPVFSIQQTDLYVPALSLADIVSGRDQSSVRPDDYPIGAVPFWSDLHAFSQLGVVPGTD